MFEFSGACAGCGETPYVKLLTQLFGDRMVVANATGCSSIYSGNLPTTPYAKDEKGHGPAWANSLFEDNAEFGLGMRFSIDQQTHFAKTLLEGLKDKIGAELVEKILANPQATDVEIDDQRANVKALRDKLAGIDTPEAKHLNKLADYLIKKSVWILGGDGWAYDIGFGGLDHAIASGKTSISWLWIPVFTPIPAVSSLRLPRWVPAPNSRRRVNLCRKRSGYDCHVLW